MLTTRRRALARRRAALRIARRDVLRNKSRNALVLALVTLPVLAVTGALVLGASNEVTAVEGMTRHLGQADAVLYAPEARAPVVQTPSSGASWSQDGPSQDTSPWSESEILAQLPAGTTALAWSNGSTKTATEFGSATVGLTSIDLNDPITTGLVEWQSGRAAQAPDEVVVSPALAERGFVVGQTIQLGDELVDYEVVGVAVDPNQVPERQVWALPGAVKSPNDVYDIRWLLDTPEPVTWAQVLALNRAGLAATSGYVIENPPAPSEVPEMGYDDGYQSEVMVVLALIVAMVVLEVALLAGPAFAVGAKRRTRDLAQVIATGGEPRDVRRIVLGTGLVIGVGGALLGVLLGVAGAALLAPFLEARSYSRWGPFEVPVSWVLSVAAVGVIAALAAAVAPAIAASRQDVVRALAGRRSPTKASRSWPVVGVVLLGLGLALCLGGVSAGEYAIAIGAIFAVLGVLLLIPTVLVTVARFGSALPLAGRMAVRDAARNRGRSTPAIAAVVGAVAAVTALAIASSSDFEQSRRSYVPSYAMGTTAILLSGPTDEDIAQVSAIVKTVLPTATLDAVGQIASDPYSCSELPCTVAGLAAPQVSPDCPDCGQYTRVLVGDERTSRLHFGTQADAAAKALAAGKVAVLSEGFVIDGAVNFQLQDWDGEQASENYQATGPARKVSLPAAYVGGDSSGTDPAYGEVIVLVPEALASQLGEPVTAQLLMGPEDTPTRAQQSELDERLADTGNWLMVERGFDQDFTVQFLLLAALGTFLVLGGTVIATALAGADARPDLATLAAVGASPSTRRRLAMAQAAVVAFLGSALGLAVGSIPGIAISVPLTRAYTEGGDNGASVLDIPWLLLGLVAVVVPLVAVLGAGLFTRSQLPMVARID